MGSEMCIRDRYNNLFRRPFKNIFDKILDFGKLFLLGTGVNAALSWLANPENLLKFQKMLDLITERPFLSLAALGGGALIITTVISKIVGGFRKVLFTLLNPFTYVDLFSGKTFRNDIYPEYKANRSEAPEDLIPQFPVIRKATSAFNIPFVELLGYEADDLIASYAEEAQKHNMKVTIVSSDKDLMQLVSDNFSMLDLSLIHI